MSRIHFCKCPDIGGTNANSEQVVTFVSNRVFCFCSTAKSRRLQCPFKLKSKAGLWKMKQDDANQFSKLLGTVFAATEESTALRLSQTKVEDFRMPPFSPYISGNGHLQTILSNFYPPAPQVQYTRVTLPTDDDLDVLQVDIANGTMLEPEQRDQPVALLLHGLESCSMGTVTLRLADALVQQGFKIVAMNYRSCAEDCGPPKTLRLYHAGFTEDVTTVLRTIRAAAEKGGGTAPNVFLCGFSLGSNIMCNFLREAGANAFEKYRVVSAFGACTPFDPKTCQLAIDSGLRGMIYSRRLVKTMVSKFDAAMEAGVPLGGVNPEAVRKSSRIGEIDNYLIAPVFGFQDKYDYYQAIDARKCLQHISVPTILMNARNDPFYGHQDGTSFPTKEDIGNAPVRLIITESGGHCGFMDYDGFYKKQPMYYQRVCAMFCSYIRNS